MNDKWNLFKEHLFKHRWDCKVLRCLSFTLSCHVRCHHWEQLGIFNLQSSNETCMFGQFIFRNLNFNLLSLSGLLPSFFTIFYFYFYESTPFVTLHICLLFSGQLTNEGVQKSLWTCDHTIYFLYKNSYFLVSWKEAFLEMQDFCLTAPLF